MTRKPKVNQVFSSIFLTVISITAQAESHMRHLENTQLANSTLPPYLVNEVMKPFGAIDVVDPSRIEKLLESGDWYCDNEKKLASTSVSRAEELLKDPKQKEAFDAHIKKNTESIQELYLSKIEDPIVAKNPSEFGIQILRVARLSGLTQNKLGLVGFRTLALEPSAWLSEDKTTIASYLSELVLKHNPKLDPEKKIQLNQISKNKKGRIDALIKLALSPEANNRELFKQLVITLPAVKRDVSAWLKENFTQSQSNSECDSLRLDKLLVENPLLEKILKMPNLVKATISRLANDETLDLSGITRDNLQLQKFLLPHLLRLEEQKDRRLSKVVKELSPDSRAHFDTLKQHIEKVPTPSKSEKLSEVKDIPEGPKREDKSPVNGLADVLKLREDPVWECNENGWDSPRQRAQEALLGNEALRSIFIKNQSEFSKRDYANIFANFKEGNLSEEEFQTQLRSFQSKYYITEEAFLARDFLIDLEGNETLKVFLKRTAKYIATEVGKEKRSENTPLAEKHFHELVEYGINSMGISSQKYQSLMLEMPKYMREVYKRYIGMDLFIQGSSETEIACLTANLSQYLASEIAGLKSKTKEVLKEVLADIRKRKPKSKKIVPHLMDLLSSKIPDIRRGALQTIGSLGELAHTSVPDLVKFIYSESYAHIKEDAIAAIGDIGPAAKEAIPELIKLFDPGSSLGQKFVKDSISLDDRGILTLEEKTSIALTKIGTASIPPLVNALSSENKLISSQASLTLERIGENAVPELIEKLKKNNSDVNSQKVNRSLVLLSLYRIAGKSKTPKMAQCFIESLSDNDSEIRKISLEGLGRLGPIAKEAVPLIIGALKDENPEVQRSAIIALSNIGPLAKDALPILKARKDTEQDVRELINKAIDNIEGK